jgi:hypothetical protein
LTAQIARIDHAKRASRFGARRPASASAGLRATSVRAATPSPAEPSAHRIVSSSDSNWPGDHENDRPRVSIASTAWSSSKLSPTRMSTAPTNRANCQPTDDRTPASPTSVAALGRRASTRAAHQPTPAIATANPICQLSTGRLAVASQAGSARRITASITSHLPAVATSASSPISRYRWRGPNRPAATRTVPPSSHPPVVQSWSHCSTHNPSHPSAAMMVRMTGIARYTSRSRRAAASVVAIAARARMLQCVTLTWPNERSWPRITASSRSRNATRPIASAPTTKPKMSTARKRDLRPISIDASAIASHPIDWPYPSNWRAMATVSSTPVCAHRAMASLAMAVPGRASVANGGPNWAATAAATTPTATVKVPSQSNPGGCESASTQHPIVTNHAVDSRLTTTLPYVDWRRIAATTASIRTMAHQIVIRIRAATHIVPIALRAQPTPTTA